MSRRYYKIFFPNYFRKSRPPIAPLEFRPGAKSYFRWSSTYQLFQKKFGLETCFFLIFRFQDIKKCPTSGNHKKNPFHFKPSGSHFTETLFQTSTPCRVPSKELISWDFRPWGNLLAWLAGFKFARGTGWRILGEPAGPGQQCLLFKLLSKNRSRQA